MSVVEGLKKMFPAVHIRVFAVLEISFLNILAEKRLLKNRVTTSDVDDSVSKQEPIAS